MTIALVRHAKAGSRQRWSKADHLRPLSKPGRVQALAVADNLSASGITRIVSSPFVRCRQTIEPLADRIGVGVELSDALAEGASLTDSLLIVEKLLDQDVVLCTHGDVLSNLLDHYARHGVPLDNHRLEKGSTWQLDVIDGHVRAARYVPPPAG